MKRFCFASMFFILIGTVNPAIATLTGIQILSEQYCVQGEYAANEESYSGVITWYYDNYSFCSNNSSGVSGYICSDSLGNPNVNWVFAESRAERFYVQAHAVGDLMCASSDATASLSFQSATSGWLHIEFEVYSRYPGQSYATLDDATASVQLLMVHDDFDHPVSLHNLWLDNTHVYSLYLTASSSQGDDSWAATDLSFTPIPEPATLLLLGFGGMALLRRRRTLQ